MISERSENSGFKSSILKFPIDPSKNSLLSNDLTKKNSEKKMSDFNKSTDMNIKKSKIKYNDNDSIFKAYEKDSAAKKKIKTKTEIKKINKIIVDDIKNIYSCLGDKSSKKYYFQKIILLMISFFASFCHWIFLFLTKSKLENNYCFSNLNQLDNCIESQICGDISKKINNIIYNDSFAIENDSLTESQKHIEEFKSINTFYKSVFTYHYYRITKDKLLSFIDPNKCIDDKINFVVILTKKEKWNIFMLFSNMCLKDNIYLFLLLIIIAGGGIGSIIFGLLADIYGRKKLIIILLSLICLSFSFLIAITFYISSKNDIFKNEFKDMFSAQVTSSIFNALEKMYIDIKISQYFEFMVPLYLISLFILCLALRPIDKISLALLLENSINDLSTLENFMKYNFIKTGISHFFAFIILVLTNNFYIFLFICEFFFFFLLIASILFINESIRYHYEYCEWNDLTNEVYSLFKITGELPLNNKNNIEYEAYRVEENRQMNGNYIKRINSIFGYVKERLTYLKRDIIRNSSFIIKKEEVKFNPLVILTSLSANRVFNRLKFLLLIILLIIYIQIFFVEKELVEIPFMKISDLYLDINNNYIINSNFFILMIVSLISNFFYYICYRISCFKLIYYPSIVFLTILLIIYHYISGNESEVPVNLNLFNFNMKELNRRRNLPFNTITVLFFIYFFLIGIKFYINIIVTKITKTLYRCSLFGINSLLEVLAIAFGETLKYQINNCFLIIAGLNTIGIVSDLYLGELKGIPNIVNDLKKDIKINENKEKSKKTIL